MAEFIPRSTELSDSELKAEDDFATAIESDVTGHLDRYQKQFGNVINTDSAKLLYAPFADNADLKIKYSRAVYGPAKWLMNQLYQRRVGDAQTEFIIFMAGGTASGKSSCAGLIIDDLESADLIVDGTLSNTHLAETQVGLALDLGKTVQITFIFCEIQEALMRAVRRSLQINRTLSLNVFAGSHFHCRKTVLHLFNSFRGQSNFQLQIIDNSGKPTELSESEIPFFLEAVQILDLEELEHQVYDWFGEACLEYERKTGSTIPSNIRDAFLSKGREVSET